MKMTYTVSQAAHELLDDKHANWSYAGAYALCEWLEELEEGTDEEIELDPVAFRCEFSEYGSALEAVADYDFEPSCAELDPDEAEEEALEWLRDRTTVIEFNGGVIIQLF